MRKIIAISVLFACFGLLFHTHVALAEIGVANGRWIESFGPANGFDLSVDGFIVYDGELIAMGAFRTFGWDSCGGIAVYDGQSFHQLGSHFIIDGGGGWFTSATPYNDGLVACCHFAALYWDGSTWDRLFNAHELCCLYTSVQFQDWLIVAGDLGDMSPCRGFYLYEGGTASCIWQLTEPVFSLVVWRDSLYLDYGGRVVNFDPAVGEPEPVGADTALVGKPLGAYNGNLIASGIGDENIAAYDGSSWTPLGTGIEGAVNDMCIHDGILVIVGNITSAGGQPAQRIAFWDGTDWYVTLDGPDQEVLACESYNGRLYLGGWFENVGSIPSLHIAAWEPYGCCISPSVGDLDQSATGEESGVTLADLTLMIDMLFMSLGDNVCVEEADIDFSGQPTPTFNDVTLGDLTLLIDHLFVSLTPLDSCP